MTQIFDEAGKVIPVTLVKAGPCWVTQERTKETDGYQAVQVGFEEVKENRVKKPQRGHLKKTKLDKNFRHFKEFEASDLKTGHKIDVSIFNEGEIVKVVGISKGKGFQGVVKRHGFKGMPASHGTKHTERAPGSIGSAFPQRVFKGKKMAGRMGSDRVTIKGLEIVQIDKENDLLAIEGALPGKVGTLLEIVAIKEIETVKEEEKEKLVADLKQKDAEVKDKKGGSKEEKKEEPKTEEK